jgi:GNAT superfamily N-acetyltransferase
MSIQIVRAEPKHANELKRLAIASKAHWGYPEEWMTRWGNLLRLDAEYVDTHHVYAAFTEDELIGFYALVRAAEICTLDHLWVAPSRIGKGIGRRLFEDAVRRATALGATRLELEAEPHALGFYEHMGAHYQRDTFSEMERTLPIMGMEIGPVQQRGGTH